MQRVFIHRTDEGLTSEQEDFHCRKLYREQRKHRAHLRSLVPDDGKTIYYFCYGESTAGSPKIYTYRLSSEELDTLVPQMAENGYVLCDIDGSNRQL